MSTREVVSWPDLGPVTLEMEARSSFDGLSALGGRIATADPAVADQLMLILNGLSRYAAHLADAASRRAEEMKIGRAHV